MKNADLDRARKLMQCGTRLLQQKRPPKAETLLVRARALLDGRLAPSAADVVALARPVLIHRMAGGAPYLKFFLDKEEK